MSNLNKKAFERLKELLQQEQPQVIILKGPAGTGKTTLVKHLIQWLGEEEIAPHRLMASTGRAAKILRTKTGSEAFTVHSSIFAFVGLAGDEKDLEFTQDGKMKDGENRLVFSLASNEDEPEDIIYIIDEASMISDVESGQTSFSEFGSGRLLADILRFAEHRKIIFVGDEYQLPPVSSEKISPALHKEYLQEIHGITVEEVNLTEIHRFNRTGFIYHLSTHYRKRIDDQNHHAAVRPGSSDDINLYSGFSTFFNAYISLIKDRQYQKSTLITPSNSMAGQFNRAVRSILFPARSTVQPGDLLLVTQNSSPFFLYNGDLIEVLKLSRRISSNTGLTFLQMQIKELILGEEKEILLIEDLLYDGKANLDAKQHQKLIIEFTYRCRERNIKPKSAEFYLAMKEDPYLNAVRAKFGYGITCHKAQGGEWEHVFIRTFPYLEKWEHPKADQWKYTALTRAQSQLHLIRGSLNVTVIAPT